MNASTCRTAALLGFLAASAAAQTIPSTWVAHFDGPAHYDDFATSTVVLASGNVAVAGTTWWEPQSGLFVPKIFTALYSPQGAELWSRQWGTGYYGGNGAADHVALAPGNRLVVSGQRNLGADWVLLEYDEAGALQWESIWLAGSWFVSSPSGIAVDVAGNTYLSGDIGDPLSGAARAAVVKVGPTGAQLWSRLYDGTGSAVESASSIAVDVAGTVFVTGGQTDSNGVQRFSVMRIDPANGAPLWIQNHGSTTSGGYSYGRAIGIDGAGNAIAGGEVENTATQSHGWSFVRYAQDGTLLWRADHAAAPNTTEIMADLAVSPAGDAAAAGWAQDSNGQIDWLVMRVSAGQVAWTRTQGGSAGLDDQATSVAIDAQGAVQAAGFVHDPDLALDLLVYTSAGTLFAHARESAPPGGFGSVSDLALSPSGGSYVVGELGPFVNGGDAVTLAFDLAFSQIFCVAKANSLNCTPAISSSGTSSASAATGFAVQSVNMRNQKVGILLYTDGGRNNAPFSGGTLCVGGALRRVQGLSSGGTPLPASDCSGVLSVDINAFRAGALGGNPAGFLSVAGTVIDCQFWGRDPGFPAPNNTQLSDGLEFTVGI